MFVFCKHKRKDIEDYSIFIGVAHKGIDSCLVYKTTQAAMSEHFLHKHRLWDPPIIPSRRINSYINYNLKPTSTPQLVQHL